jgi:uncharacterized membrane protein
MLMANSKPMTHGREFDVHPAIRRIGTGDLKDALARGLDDFLAMPTQMIFLALIYPVIGLILGRLTSGYDLLPLFYPLVAGFALIGPLAGVGLYEMSRRRERGLPVSWRDGFKVLNSHATRAIVILGALLMAIFLAWLAVAHAIYTSIFGDVQRASYAAFLRDVFASSAGWRLIVVGNAVGFMFAVLTFAISVVSFPMILDRDVGAATAIHTSVRAVLANPVTMAVWALIIAGLLVIGFLPFLLGLAIVMPVLGHASWHLYRKVVEPW